MARTFIECTVKVLESGRHYLTSGYGKRGTGYHYGCDFVGGTNERAATDYVVAFEGGTVTKATNDVDGKKPAEGNAVVIKHESGISSYYYHLKKGSVKVKAGDIVARGDVLGYMGNTGNSSGAHLHFGLKKSGKWLDPLPYLTGEKSLGYERFCIKLRSLCYIRRGRDVKALQSLLNGLCGENLELDGCYGAKTRAAVRAFQKSHSLTVDGICGKKTWAALLSGETD